MINETEKSEGIGEDENRFSVLCNNVVNSFVLIQNSYSELLEFKSILLKENIAPSVLVKLSLITGKTFRSISDLHNPLGELIRLVRVYAESWEQKSQALRKLHRDYEKKSGQLNVALRRLAKQNEETKRVTHKETLQNWEYLFTRTQLDRNHGSRWKYRMFEFKLKASRDIGNLQDYFQQLLDEDDGIKVKAKDLPTVVTENKINEFSISGQDEKSLKNVEDEKLFEEEYQESIEERDDVETPEPIITVDTSVGTSDLDFVQTLVMRIYNPKDIGSFDPLMCRIIYGNETYQTENLNKSQQIEEEEARLEKESANALEPLQEASKPKGGLIGRGKKKQVRMQEKSIEQIRKEQHEKRLRLLSWYEEIRIVIPSDVVSGVNKNTMFQAIKFILFVDHDKTEKEIAQATIDLEEINNLDLPIFKEFVYQGDMVTPPPFSNLDDKPFGNLEPMTFPLYEYQETINSEESPIQIGQLPLACFYSRQESYKMLHKTTETQCVNQLTDEMKNVDLNTQNQEDLDKERKVDKSTSPRLHSPLSSSKPKLDIDDIKARYEDEIKSIRKYYENKIQELLEKRPLSSDKEKSPFKSPKLYHKDCASSPILPYRSLHGNKRTEKPNRQYPTNNEVDNPFSSKSRNTLSTSGPDDQDEILYSNFDKEPYEQENRKTSDSKANLPENFLERMSFYSQLSNRHKDELSEKIKSEISKAIEEKLSELYQLHSGLSEEDVSLALADICLPAMFMPLTNSSGTVYNPRAHQYFHPMGLKNIRVSQPPSIFKLPPINNHQMSILNLFEIGNQMQIKSMLKNQYMESEPDRILKHTSFI